MEWKSFASKVNEADAESLTITHLITCDVRDRVGDRLHPDGAVIEGKPVFLWQHGLDERIGKEPIGKPLSIRPGDYQGHRALIAKSQFFPDSLGRRLFEKVKGGFLPNFSLGFIPLEWTPFNDSLGGRDIKRFELLEYSLCSVPCNPYATVIADGKNLSQICFKILPGETVLDQLARRVLQTCRSRSRNNALNGQDPKVRRQLIEVIRQGVREAFPSLGKGK